MLLLSHVMYTEGRFFSISSSMIMELPAIVA
jgi:hypothetical protein